MTRKDYRIIAQALRESKPRPASPAKLAQWEKTTLAIARALAADNPNFRPEMFMAAINNGDAK